jgi:hypothetical protein
VPRDFHVPNPDRQRPPWYRVVQHDQPERLELHPELERDWTVREWTRRLAWLALTAGVLGLSWALGEALAMALRYGR